MTMPPGPSFGPLQGVLWSKDPVAYYQRNFARYGDPFTMPNFVGQKYFSTHDPAVIKTIFGADPDNFEPPARWTLEPVLGPGSLIVRSGAGHKAHRRLLMPPFHGERMRSYGLLMQGIASRLGAARGDGRPFSMHELAADVALESILQACFGIEDPARVEEFRVAILAFVTAISPLVIFVRSMRHAFGGLGPWARLKQTEARFHGLLIEEIHARRAAGTEGRTDILSLLLAARDEDGAPMSDDDLRDELVTMVVAGHETTATSMSWAVYGVLRNPGVQERLLAEVLALGPSPDPEALAKLPYLEAVCYEALRLWPVLVLTARQVTRPFAIAGFEVPTGEAVCVAIVAVHHREELYPEPHRFRPERFLEKKFGLTEFMPFGGGARRCIGAAFALYQMKIVLGTLLSAHVLKLADDTVERPQLRNITFSPKHGVRVIRVGARQ